MTAATLSERDLDENGEPYNKDFGGKGYKPNDYDTPSQMPSLLEEAYNAALKAAGDMCDKSKSCCKEVTVKVECSEDITKQETKWRPIQNSINESGDEKMCGKSTPVPCNK